MSLSTGTRKNRLPQNGMHTPPFNTGSFFARGHVPKQKGVLLESTFWANNLMRSLFLNFNVGQNSELRVKKTTWSHVRHCRHPMRNLPTTHPKQLSPGVIFVLRKNRFFPIQTLLHTALLTYIVHMQGRKHLQTLKTHVNKSPFYCSHWTKQTSILFVLSVLNGQTCISSRDTVPLHLVGPPAWILYFICVKGGSHQQPVLFPAGTT